MAINRDPAENARLLNIQAEARHIARAILLAFGKVARDEGQNEANGEEAMTKIIAVELEPIVARTVNLEQSYDELTRRFNVATLTHKKPEDRLDRTSRFLMPFAVVGLIFVAVEVKDRRDDRAIVDELTRQVGNADETRIGMQMHLVADKDGKRHETRKPVSAWDKLEEFEGRLDRLEIYSVRQDLGWWTGNQVLDNAEVNVLANDQTQDLLRILLDQDMDGDGFVNRVDFCIDTPGLEWNEEVNDGIHDFDGCPDPRIDTDKDGIADYRDQCIQPVAEGEQTYNNYDSKTMHGARSIFPADQGCSMTQVANRCTKPSAVDATTGLVNLAGCPGGHHLSCKWTGTSYAECDE